MNLDPTKPAIIRQNKSDPEIQKLLHQYHQELTKLYQVSVLCQQDPSCMNRSYDNARKVYSDIKSDIDSIKQSLLLRGVDPTFPPYNTYDSDCVIS